MSSEVVLKDGGITELRGRVDRALIVLQDLKDDWPISFWSSYVGKPLWVWKYGIPRRVAPKTWQEAQNFYDWAVGYNRVCNRYNRGEDWLEQGITVLTNTKFVLEVFGTDGQITLSSREALRLMSALNIDHTRKCLCDLQEQ